jgi:hypothetical protein
MRCWCGKHTLGSERANFVYDGVPSCSFACFSLAELLARKTEKADGVGDTRTGLEPVAAA